LFSSLANFCFETNDLLALAVRERLQNDPEFLPSHKRATVTISPANITVRVFYYRFGGPQTNIHNL
jgi:hypothetical protein